MKKVLLNLLLLLVGSITFVGCSNDAYDANHTYTVSVNYELPSGVRTNLRFYEYNEINEMVNYQNWKDVSYGGKKTFNANDFAVKLVVYAQVDSVDNNHISYYSYNYYLSQIFYLSPNTQINVDEETLIQKNNPIHN